MNVRIIRPKNNTIAQATTRRNDLFDFGVFQATYEIPESFEKEKKESLDSYKNRLMEHLNQEQDLTVFSGSNSDLRTGYDLGSVVDQTHQDLFAKRKALASFKLGNHTTAAIYREQDKTLLTLNSFSTELGRVNINGINEFYK